MTQSQQGKLFVLVFILGIIVMIVKITIILASICFVILVFVYVLFPDVVNEQVEKFRKYFKERSRINKLLEKKFGEIDLMDGHSFEYFAADLLKKRGFVRADVTSGSNDFGIDIRATDQNGLKYSIQCKHAGRGIIQKLGQRLVAEILKC